MAPVSPQSSDDLVQWDLAHVWHPFTAHDEWEADAPPVVIERAEGMWLVDTLGRRYLDGVSSLWTNVHGHRHPALDAAVRAQLERHAHSTLLGLAGAPAATLARRLVETVAHLPAGAGAGPAGRGPLTRAFFSDAGSTATEIALKIAFQWQQQQGHTQRTRFAALSQAYHGDTIGSVSVGGIDLFHSIYRPMLFDAVRVPAPDRADPAEEAACLAQAEALFATHGPELAALIVEPLVQGAAGMRMHSPAYLRRLVELAHGAGVLVIVDEVATGFGRTGTMFALDQVGLTPDLLCLAKGLTGGYLPLAATLARESIFDAFRGPYTQWRTFFHGHTYTGNALACAAALASLELFDTGAVLDGLPTRVQALTDALETLPPRHVAEIRQRGLMAGVVLRHDREPDARIGHRVCMAARGHGVMLRPLGDTLVFMPPLAMSPDHIHQVVAGAAAGLAEVLGD